MNVYLLTSVLIVQKKNVEITGRGEILGDLIPEASPYDNPQSKDTIGSTL